MCQSIFIYCFLVEISNVIRKTNNSITLNMCCFAKNKTKAKYSGSVYFSISTLAPPHEQNHKQNIPDLNNLLFLRLLHLKQFNLSIHHKQLNPNNIVSFSFFLHTRFLPLLGSVIRLSFAFIISHPFLLLLCCGDVLFGKQ